MLEHASPRRRIWRQWSLRALFLFVLGVAVVCVLFGERIRRGERQRYVLAEIERLGGDLEIDVRFSDEVDGTRGTLPVNRDRDRWRGSYMRTLAEIDLLSDEVPDRLLANIGRLPDVQQLRVTPPVHRSPAMQRFMTARPDLKVYVSWSPRHVPFREVASPDELREAITTGNAVLFTDGGWNIDCAAARPQLADFHEAWMADPTAPPVIWLRADLSTYSNPHADAFREWLWEIGLSPGGLKSMGAGWIIWLKDGAIRDATWCFQVTGKEELHERTHRAFAALESESGTGE